MTKSKALWQSEHQLEAVMREVTVEQTPQNRYDVDMMAGQESGRAGEREQAWVVVVVVRGPNQESDNGRSNKQT